MLPVSQEVPDNYRWERLWDSTRGGQRTIADAWARGRASSLFILIGDKSFHLQTIGLCLVLTPFYRAAKRLQLPWNMEWQRLRDIMGLMLFNPGGVNSNFIALKGAWQCCHQLVVIDVPCVTGGARQLRSWTNLGLYRKKTADNSRRLGSWGPPLQALSNLALLVWARFEYEHIYRVPLEVNRHEDQHGHCSRRTLQWTTLLIIGILRLDTTTVP